MKPTIPQVIERFANYVGANPSWGSLHIVLDDGNVRDSCVEFCQDYAALRGDWEGSELAEILLQMSRTQRSKIGHMAEAYRRG